MRGDLVPGRPFKTPPSVVNLTGHESLLQGPGGSPYTLINITRASRVWSAVVCLDMESNTGTTEAAYARVYTSAGGTLAIAQCGTAASGASSNANVVVPYPGKAVNPGESILLDVNNGVSIASVVIRASGLVAVSIP